MTPRAQWPVATIAVAVAAVAVAATPDLAPILIGSRRGILSGELWRLLTGHLVHASTYHLAVDLAAWLVLGAIYEPRLGRSFPWIAGCAAMTVGAGVAVLRPDVAAYAGLSGVVAGVWVGGSALAAHVALRRNETRAAILHGIVLAAASTKIAAECLVGSGSSAELLGATPVPIAHALGAAGGLAAAMALTPGHHAPGRALLSTSPR